MEEIKELKSNKYINKTPQLSKLENNEDFDSSSLEKTILTLKDNIVSSKTASELQKHLIELESKISSTAKSVTSIPKPLEILLPFFENLSLFYKSFFQKESISKLADILSCLSIIIDSKDKNCLKYKLESNDDIIDRWGHEYVRHLSKDIVSEFSPENPFEKDTKIYKLIENIVEYDIKEASESEAIDLLIEVQMLPLIIQKVDSSSALKLGSYLLNCRQYIPKGQPKSSEIVDCAAEIFLRHGRYSRALFCAFFDDNENLALRVFSEAKTASERLQLALIVGTHRGSLSDERTEAFISSAKKGENFDEKEEDSLRAALGAEEQGKRFSWLAKELNLTEPKKLEDIYKSHLIDRSTFKKIKDRDREKTSLEIISARENLASSIVNAFVHAGFGSDALNLASGNGDWPFRNKGIGMAVAAASTGMINLWDIEKGFQSVDRFSDSDSALVSAGSIIGFGMVGVGLKSEFDASSAMIMDHLEGSERQKKLFSLIALGLTAAGSEDMEIADSIQQCSKDYADEELCATACIALGLIFMGSCKDKAGIFIFSALTHFSEQKCSNENFLAMATGLALTFIATQDKSEEMMESLNVLENPKRNITKALLRAFAYVGSGNVLVFHSALKEIRSFSEAELKKLGVEENGKEGDNNENKKEEKQVEIGGNKMTDENIQTDIKQNGDNEKGENSKSNKEETERKKKILKENFKQKITEAEITSKINVMALALIPMGEKLGSKMAYRIFDEILRYKNTDVRRAVPLALAAAFASNPNYATVQLLSKLSHDPDDSLSKNAILALGLVASGTNNSRVAKTLRKLAVYYQKDSDHLFVTRISQGLVHCGKGLMTISPLHSDGMIVNKAAVAGLMILLLSCFDMKKGILSGKQNLLFYLSLALRPRVLMTVDEALQPLPVPVHVGLAADSPRLAGETKTITGFQTHYTPVLLASGEKAELATRKYVALNEFLEGVVVLKRNPKFVEEDTNEAMKDE